MQLITTCWPALKKSAVVFGMISLLLTLPIYFFLPELTESIIGLLILGLLLLLISIIGNWKPIKAFVFSIPARHLFTSLIMILLFITVLFLANILGIIKPYRFDLTASGKFTLSPQSIKTIKTLMGPVKAIGFFPDEPSFEAPKRMAQNLLEEYRYWNKKFNFQFIDPEAKPALANQYRIKSHGTIVFEGMGRQKAVLEPTEQNFTNALLEISGIQAKKVYVLTGNGEHDINLEDQDGYGEARRGLIRDLYKVTPFNLSLSGEIPEDCAVLIMAGTKKALPSENVAAIKNFLINKGKALILIDPNPPEQIKGLLSDWGLKVNNGRVMDPGAFVAPDMGMPAVFKGQYPAVVITRGLDTTYFPEAASFGLSSELSRVLEAMQNEGEVKTGWPFQPVQFRSLAILPAVLSTSRSWMEEAGKEVTRSEKKPGVQALGVMVLGGGALGEESSISQSGKKEKLTRLVVIGDSDFASNQHFRNGGNGDLFLNAVNWLAEEEHLISIRPKPYTFRRLLINQNELRFIRYSSLGFLPLLLLIIGGIMWWKRR